MTFFLTVILSQVICGLTIGVAPEKLDIRTSLRQSLSYGQQRTEVVMKKCTKCKQSLDESRFYTNKPNTGKQLLHSQCKECVCKRQTAYRRKNKDKVRESKRKYALKNKDKIAIKTKEWHDAHKEYCSKYIKAYREKNKERLNRKGRERYAANIEKLRLARRQYVEKNRKKCAESCRKWYKKNKERQLKYCRKYNKERRAKDINFRLKANIRGRMCVVLSGRIKKSKSLEALIGCTVPEFRAHLESLFTDGMTWENYGKGGWQVDHIVPCASFDFTDQAQQEACFHYSNTQPLWVKDNLKKRAKTDGQLRLKI